ncbi:glycosyl hydrolase [Pedobacter antarcticus]|uniref:glycosyl hydrolase n=1 Tax=Pedobacter antarcticus TaxID=34086 RepID=UPI00292EADCE|nr:glycosyl hydrolase [Pedobacter antarcticus]
MNQGQRINLILLLSLIGFNGLAQQRSGPFSKTAAVRNNSSLQEGFRIPPDSIQTSVYWYWMSDNISASGVVKDLHAMKKAGINRAFIGNIGYPSTPYGSVKLFSEQWWAILDTALNTATKLNIEIGIFNSPGWSQSGGPWIKANQSMRYLATTEKKVKGGTKVSIRLDKPKDEFQDVKVLAFPAPEGYGEHLSALKPVIKTNVPVSDAAALADGDYTQTVKLPAGKSVQVDLKIPGKFKARSLVIYPAHQSLKAKAELQVFDGTIYTTVKKFDIDRSNPALNVGFDPFAPVAVSFPEIASGDFRLIISSASEGFGLNEIEISAAPVIEDYSGKTLAKMFQSPLPYWNEYQWKAQAVVDSPALLIDPEKVIDVSAGLSPDDSFSWKFPAGDWIVMRTGMTPTQVTNSPASVEGTGLEVDKMSKEHIASHFDSFLGEILRRIPAEHRKTWRVAVEDSYETGGQNWTDQMQEKFVAAYGYDPTPYLPVISGKVVGSQDRSDRFLWDLRRLIADRVAYDYVGGLKAISNKHGLTTWLENYGHWGFPGEFLQYGGQSDEIGGEFWSEGELGDIENRAASSAAHIYGKNKVSAESFTAGGKSYARYPALMKQRGDRFFTEGINNTLLHLFIQQPDERVPGINAEFGNEFNRHNTWFSYMDLFTAYLKRCNYMLQQGKYVADVAYFIGEDAPKMTGVTDPALPKGYAFDYINAEVLMTRTVVKDGRLLLPDGMNYGLLVLPKLETMRPELLEKIRILVEQGANILGPAPLRSPSLQGYPRADQEVKRIAASIWGEVAVKEKSIRKYGKGQVMQNMDMQEALDQLQIRPDFKLLQSQPVLYIHRRLADKDIYFISNQTSDELQIDPAFRVEGKEPSLWDPVQGITRTLPEYVAANGQITVPLKLAPLESFFLVFEKKKSQSDNLSQKRTAKNFPELKLVQELTGSWELYFEDQQRGPKKPVVFNQLEDWTKRPEDDIRYYSGTVGYQKMFNYKPGGESRQIILETGEIRGMARVKVNGKEIGGLWTAPWSIDISSALKSGENKLEILVVNTWVNRLIGDSRLQPEHRTTWTSVNPFKPENQLELSGLTGPVKLYSMPVAGK